MNLTRIAVPAMDDLLGKEIPVLDQGFVIPVDYLGGDASIVRAARVSYLGSGEGKTALDDRRLIRRLIRDRHTSPLEMCEVVFHVKLPIFVARQWVRHRTASLNEQSGRYTVLDEAFYTPERDRICIQSKTNKQGGNEEVDDEVAGGFLDLHAKTCHDAFAAYNWCLQEDISREVSRIDLPLSTYTQWYWKIDLHNLFHFLRLRMAPDAQYEIREYANAIADVVRQWVPMAYGGFCDYVLNSKTLSSMELNVLFDVMNKRQIGSAHYYGMTDAEYDAFLKWISSYVYCLIFP